MIRNVCFRCFSLFVLVIVFVGCCQAPVDSIDNLSMSTSVIFNRKVRYEAFALRAREEGLVNVANMFDALACSEAIQLTNQRQVLSHYGVTDTTIILENYTVGLTLENLNATIALEENEYAILYPKFNATALKEGAQDLETQFYNLAASARKHTSILRNTARVLAEPDGDSLVVRSWSICPTCGFVYVTAYLVDKCDYCHCKGSDFLLL